MGRELKMLEVLEEIRASGLRKRRRNISVPSGSAFSRFSVCSNDVHDRMTYCGMILKRFDESQQDSARGMFRCQGRRPNEISVFG